MHTPDHANHERITVYATTDRGGRRGTVERYRQPDGTPGPWRAFTDTGRHVDAFATDDAAAAALVADKEARA